MAKFLITGITGFAGPHLANLLYKEGHKIYGLIRRTNGMESDIRDVVPDDVYESLTFVYGDLTNYRSLRTVFEKEHVNVVGGQLWVANSSVITSSVSPTSSIFLR